uniref:Stress-activated protein kinase JNK n=1 Tax=Parascaris univalens TaxID=6257 RepID=A0A915A8J9_PARUN
WFAASFAAISPYYIMCFLKFCFRKHFNTEMMQFETHMVKGGVNSFPMTLPSIYRNLKTIGQGSQGVVVSADVIINGVFQRKVAIKKWLGMFHDGGARAQRLAQLAYREVSFMATLTHPNLMSLECAFIPPGTNVDNFDHFYVVMELQDQMLTELIRPDPSIFKLEHKDLSFLIYQLIVGVHHLHAQGIIHRDLKPENIAISNHAVLKILDYGLSRIESDNAEMTQYVVTRPYRAPEIVLCMPYDNKVDVWSIGCIMAEMILHKRLFYALNSRQLYRNILRILGSPSADFIARVNDPAVSEAIEDVGNYVAKPFDEIFPDNFFKPTDRSFPHLNADNARDLLENMLKIDPNERYNVQQAVQHPYVSRWFRENEWNHPQVPVEYREEDNEARMTADEWRGMLFAKIVEIQNRTETIP